MFELTTFYKGLRNEPDFSRLPTELFEIIQKYHDCYIPVQCTVKNHKVNSNWKKIVVHPLVDIRIKINNNELLIDQVEPICYKYAVVYVGFIFNAFTMCNAFEKLHFPETDVYMKIPYKYLNPNTVGSKFYVAAKLLQVGYKESVLYDLPLMDYIIPKEVIPTKTCFVWRFPVPLSHLEDLSTCSPPQIVDLNGNPYMKIKFYTEGGCNQSMAVSMDLWRVHQHIRKLEYCIGVVVKNDEATSTTMSIKTFIRGNKRRVIRFSMDVFDVLRSKAKCFQIQLNLGILAVYSKRRESPEPRTKWRNFRIKDVTKHIDASHTFVHH